MVGNAGYMTDIEPGTLASMIDLTKKAETGYGPLFAVSDSKRQCVKNGLKRLKPFVHIVA